MASQEVEAGEMILRHPRPNPQLVPSIAAFALGLAALSGLTGLGCSSHASAQAGTGTTVAKTTAAPATPTRITSFAVSNENLNVDKVGLRDGFMKPDGARDLAFTLTIDGPFESLFVVSTNAKGDPGYGLRADTLVGTEEIPTELGGVIDTGKMTVGIAVVENGKFINGESGSAHGGPGVHTLTLYIPNPATLQAGSFVRPYLRAPGSSALLPGPVIPY
jgi:hypothetical protein